MAQFSTFKPKNEKEKKIIENILEKEVDLSKDETRPLIKAILEKEGFLVKIAPLDSIEKNELPEILKECEYLPEIDLLCCLKQEILDRIKKSSKYLEYSKLVPEEKRRGKPLFGIKLNIFTQRSKNEEGRFSKLLDALLFQYQYGIDRVSLGQIIVLLKKELSSSSELKVSKLMEENAKEVKSYVETLEEIVDFFNLPLGFIQYVFLIRKKQIRFAEQKRRCTKPISLTPNGSKIRDFFLDKFFD